MRKSTLRRLDALERNRQKRLEGEERYRQKKKYDDAHDAFFYIKTIVLAYYVGGLQPEEAVVTGYARALNYQSAPTDFREFLEDALSKDEPDFKKRTHEAELRLYARVGIDAEHAPEDVLFDALFTLANQLPEKWLRHIIRGNPMVEFGPGADLPIRFPSA